MSEAKPPVPRAEGHFAPRRVFQRGGSGTPFGVREHGRALPGVLLRYDPRPALRIRANLRTMRFPGEFLLFSTTSKAMRRKPSD